MNKIEREKIYKLLSQFYPKARQLHSRETLTAYGLILARFPYEDVKNAVLNHAAKSRYFPDISELVGNLNAESADAPATEGRRTDELMPYVEAMFSKPWTLCRALILGREDGGPVGAIFDKYVPEACEGCRRQLTCISYQKRTGGHK